MTRETSPARASRGRAAPQSDARSLLASGQWTTAAAYADLLGDGISPEQAVACWQRLNRAGHEFTDDERERVQLGRERLAQEALQRLVQRGEMEAVGTGPQRQYRITSREISTVFAPRPKPTRRTVPLERLTFPLALQMRELFNDAGEQVPFNEAWVQRLVELRQGDPPAQFEPLEAVEEERKGKESVFHVFRGFHRGEMWRRIGANSVEVLVYPGTFADAQFFALVENSAQPLPRTPADCRRAFDTMIDTPALLRRVMEAGEKVGGGGVHRAMAAACGISHGAVGKYLADRNLTVDRKARKLVSIEAPYLSPPPAPPPPPPPARASTPAPAPKSEPTVKAREDSAPPAPSQPTVSACDTDPDLSLAKDGLAEVAKLLRAVGRQVEYLVGGQSKVRDKVLAAAERAGVGFNVTEVPYSQSINDVGIASRRVTTWPALEGMQAVFAQVAAQLHDDAARRAADEVAR